MRVASTSEVKDGEKKEVRVGDKTILLINNGGDFFAIDAACPHRKLPLVKGRVEGLFITCAFHGSKFNLMDGSVVNGPAVKPVATYRVKVEGENIDIEV